MSQINTKNKTTAYLAMFAFVVLQALLLNDCLASTGTTMTAPLKSINDLISGDAAKIIAGISFFFGIVGSIVRFNVAAIATAFGVAITAGAGPTVVQSLVTATF
jgi:hypothetical protein